MLNSRYHLGQIAWQVQNVQNVSSFFPEVRGCPFLFSAGPNLSFFDPWGVRLMITSDRSNAPASNSVIYFRVQSVDDTYAAIKDKVTAVDQPHLVANMPDHDLYMFFIENP